MANDYKIERVRQSFALNAVRVFKYVPGVITSRAVAKGTQAYITTTNNKPYNVPPNEGEITVNRIERQSYLNTPVVSELRLVDRVQYTKFVNGQESEVILDNFLPIDTALFTVSQRKNIIRTQVQGMEGGGSIKEYISDGDYDITIQGGIYGTNGNYPKDEVENLLEYLRAPVAIGIISDYLELFEIFEIVVESYNFPQRRGRQSEQLFEIRATSNVSSQLVI